MSQLSKAQIDALKQIESSDAVWLMSVRQSPHQIQISATEAAHPYYVVILDATSRVIRSFDLAENEPAADAVAEALAQAMHAPQPSPLNEDGDALVPLRPGRVLMDDAALAEVLQAVFEPLGVAVSFFAPLTPVDELLLNLEMFIERGDHRVGLLEIPDVTPALIATLFEAAAVFHRAAPWDHVFNDDVIRLRYPGPDGDDYFVCIMGNGGLEFGLALYTSLEDLNLMLEFEDPEDSAAALQTVTVFSLTYGTRRDLLEADAKDVKRHHWPVANPRAYPILTKQDPRVGLVSPSELELKVLVAALQTLPDFVVEKMHADVDVPAESSAVYDLQAGATAELSYPVEGLVYSEDVAVDGDDDPASALINLDTMRDALGDDVDLDATFPGLRDFLLGASTESDADTIDLDIEDDDETDAPSQYDASRNGKPKPSNNGSTTSTNGRSKPK